MVLQYTEDGTGTCGCHDFGIDGLGTGYPVSACGRARCSDRFCDGCHKYSQGLRQWGTPSHKVGTALQECFGCTFSDSLELACTGYKETPKSWSGYDLGGLSHNPSHQPVLYACLVDKHKPGDSTARMILGVTPPMVSDMAEACNADCQGHLGGHLRFKSIRHSSKVRKKGTMQCISPIHPPHESACLERGVHADNSMLPSYSSFRPLLNVCMGNVI